MNLMDGVYRARAINGGLCEKDDKEYVQIEFELLSEGFQGIRITYFGYFKDKSSEFTLRALMNCGWRGDDVSDLTGILDNEVDLVVKNEVYKGKKYTKVAWVNKPGTVVMQSMDEGKARVFAARMRAQAMALRQKEGEAKPAATPSQRPPPPQSSEPENDSADIPF